jgi:hypothetical protein
MFRTGFARVELSTDKSQPVCHHADSAFQQQIQCFHRRTIVHIVDARQSVTSNIVCQQSTPGNGADIAM